MKNVSYFFPISSPAKTNVELLFSRLRLLLSPSQSTRKSSLYSYNFIQCKAGLSGLFILSISDFVFLRIQTPSCPSPSYVPLLSLLQPILQVNQYSLDEPYQQSQLICACRKPLARIHAPSSLWRRSRTLS